MPPKKTESKKSSKSLIESGNDAESDHETGNRKRIALNNSKEIIKQRLSMIVDNLDVSEDDDSKTLIKRVLLVKKQITDTLALL